MKTISFGSTTKYRILISFASILLICLLCKPLPSQESGPTVYRIKRSGEVAAPIDKTIEVHSSQKTGSQDIDQEHKVAPQVSDPEELPTAAEGPSKRDLENAAKLYHWQHTPPKRVSRHQKLIEPGNYIDHQILARVFKKYVTKKGWVNYRGLKRDKEARQMLADYVADLSEIDPSTLEDPSDRLASWLNLYNAMVIDEILKHYPIKNIMQIKDFFGKRRFKIGGKEISLLEIEKNIFKDQIREPRAVFGRVNGATSGPRLLREPFSPIKIDKQLDDVTWKFLLDRKNVDFDPKRKVLILNSSFLWYREEIVDLDAFLRSYLDLLPKYYNVAFTGYDWKLNDEKLH